MLTPAIRAKVLLPLPLLVSWVLADHEDPPVTADDLALLAHRLDRRSYLHDPFRSWSRRGGSGDRDGHRYHASGAHALAHRTHHGPSATKQNTKRHRRPQGSSFGPHQAAAAALRSCHGVRIRGPSAVMAMVNSKWAASEPSWE